MSPCYKQASVAIHFTWKQDWAAVSALLPMIEQELAPFDRPTALGQAVHHVAGSVGVPLCAAAGLQKGRGAGPILAGSSGTPSWTSTFRRVIPRRTRCEKTPGRTRDGDRYALPPIRLRAKLWPTAKVHRSL